MAVSVPVNLDDRVDQNAPAVVSAERRLADPLGRLRRHRDDLCARHVEHMWIFGSVARGEEHADSDVDIVVELDPEARVSLTSFARLQLDLADILERPVDLATWKTLREHVVDAVTRDAVMVF